MSYQEAENGGPIGEENPDPEEDSDLPQRSNEQDVPEEDIPLNTQSNHIEAEPAAPGGPSCQADSNGPAVQLANVGAEDEDQLSVEAVRDVTTNNATSASDNTATSQEHVVGAHADSVANDIEENPEDGEGDSFEQDEEIAAPECEGGLMEEGSIESDRQLQDNPVVVATGTDSAEQAAVSEGNLTSEQNASIPALNSDNSVEIAPGSFTGNVEVVTTLEDAPEAEMDGLNVPMATEANQESTPAGAAAPPESEMSDSENRTAATSANTDHAVTSRDSDQDLQVPECDRVVVTASQSSVSENTSLSPESHNEAEVVSESVSAASSSIQQQFEGSVHSDGSNTDSIAAVHSDGIRLASINSDIVHSDGANNDGTITAAVSTNSPDSVSQAEAGSSNSEETQNISASPDNAAAAANSPSIPVETKSAELMQNNDTSEKLQSDNQLTGNGVADNSSATATNIVEALPVPVEASSRLKAEAGEERKDSGSASPNRNSPKVNGKQSSPSSSRSGNSVDSPRHSVERVLSQTHTMDSASFQRELNLAFHSDDDDDDDILTQLDAEILAQSSNSQNSPRSGAESRQSPRRDVPVNGLQVSFEVSQLQKHNRELLEQLKIRDEEILRLTQERNAHSQELHALKSQSQSPSPSASADDLYLPQIKALEATITQLQNEVKVSKEKLASHDTAAKKAVTTLQNELKSRVESVTKLYEDCRKEKDMMVVRFAESEAKNMEYKRKAEKCEAKMKDAIKEKENMANALKQAKADRQKAGANFEAKCAEISTLNRELDKMKDTVTSTEFRIKWFQNKLKDELESHKETKSNLEKTNVKLKEAREETEIIRKECQAIVKRYQESEEIKSNSLDKELKMKESELKLQMQERTDTEEVHQMTKRELDSLKAQLKDVFEEAKTLKDKVLCLEDERMQNHQMIEKYQEIMQRQKCDNTELKSSINSLTTVKDDFDRAQDMIKNLDKEISDLKISNKDLQKDMELCRERESKMLSLQSELSKTNALLRSENTSLSNKASTLTGEVEKLRMEVHELESSVQDFRDKYEDEKQKRKEDVDRMTLALDEKTKESNSFKQKWEDEVDSSKTLKRRHANNVKDLTRQLHQAKKRLEGVESKGDAGSMGSRTNSNGSLNSIDNSNSHHQQQQQQQHVQQQQQEFPVITEQVEVDKQVLIERIVRLQKSLARKNEKLEFLGEHIQQLLEEIKKKNKIIQSYILREEAGTLSSEDMDANKEYVHKAYKMEAIREIQSLLSRKGGIMASVYSVHPQDGTMTLDLSLQINRKLQAVLEDTLLKNITLKENLDTLGEEIARLSQQNRKLQLHLQDLEKQ